MSDLREAAKRFRDYLVKHGDQGHIENESVLDGCEQLARAYIAEHPEDDNLIVDSEWLCTCKAISHNKHKTVYYTIDSCVNFVIRVTGIEVWIGDCQIMGNPTRGDVRLLARGLKIELKEGGKS